MLNIGVYSTHKQKHLITRRGLLGYLAFLPLVLAGILFLSPDNASAAITKDQCEAAGGTYESVYTGGSQVVSQSCDFNYTPEKELRSYSFFNAISQCMRMNQWVNSIPNPTDTTTWAGSDTISVGYIVDKTDGLLQCKNMIKPALDLWGYQGNYTQALKDFGYTELDVNGCNGTTVSGACTGNTTTSKSYVKPSQGGKLLENFQRTIGWRVNPTNGSAPTIEGRPELLYLRGQYHIEHANACAATPFKKVADLTGDEKNTYKNNDFPTDGSKKEYLIVRVVNGAPNWEAEDWVYKITGDNAYKTIKLNEKPGGGSSEFNCVQLARAQAGYADRVKADIASMIALGQDPSSKYGSIVKTPGGAVPDQPGSSGGGAGEEGASSCAITGVGWIVCPVVNFLAGLADGAFKILSDSLLRIDVKLIDTSSGTYTAWTVMRNIANVAFVIAFLFIIFSQLTGMGVSNYGVKKMLPRLVIAAILVNISFFVCQLAVDLSNLLGYSVKDALGGVGQSIVEASGSGTENPISTGEGFVGIAGSVLAFAAAGVLIYAMLSVFIPVILAAVVALIMILFILIARQAIVVMLIVLSPLAFVAFLLPNTERLFKMWRKIFTAMLLLFPIIAIVFGLSSLASDILRTAFSPELGDPGANGWFIEIVAAAVLVLPLFVIPSILKKSLDSIPMLGQMANKLSARANGRLGSAVKDSYRGSKFGRGRTVRKAAKEEFRNQQYAKSLTQDGKRGAIAQVTAGGLASLGLTKSQRAQTGAIVSSARSTVANAESKELGDALKVLEQDIASEQVRKTMSGQKFDKDDFLTTIAKDTSKGETQRSAAMHQLASLGRDKKVRELQEHFTTTGDSHSQENLQRAVSAGAGALIGKAPDLIKGGPGPAFDTVTGDQMAGFSAGTAEVHVKHLEELYTKASAPTATADERKAFNVAMTSFNSAISDISSNPTLQAKYGGDVGLKVREQFSRAGVDPGFAAYLPSSIDATTGKIR